MKPVMFFTHIAIAYDIADSKRSVKLNNLLRGYCFQQQNSFFEGQLTPSQVVKLENKILQIIDRKKDNVIIYPLTKQNIFNKKVYGKLKWRITNIF